jgi:hypothetical protein
MNFDCTRRTAVWTKSKYRGGIEGLKVIVCTQDVSIDDNHAHEVTKDRIANLSGDLEMRSILTNWRCER